MTEPRLVRIVVLITLYLAAAVIFIEGLGSERAFLQDTSWIPLAIVAALTIYDRVLWRVGPWGIPILRGTWKATLESSWRSESAPDVPVTRTAYFVFRQTSSRFTVNMYSEESSSQTFASQLLRLGDGQYELSWVYLNTPQVLKTVTGVSAIHHGGVVADNISGRQIQERHRWYFTSRETVGDFRTTNHSRTIARSLNAAKTLFGDA